MTKRSVYAIMLHMYESNIPQEDIKRGFLHAKSLYEHGQIAAADNNLEAPYQITYVDGSLNTFDVHYGTILESRRVANLKAKIANRALTAIGRAPTFDYYATVKSRPMARPIEETLRLDHKLKDGLTRPQPYGVSGRRNQLINPESDRSIAVGNTVISLDDTGLGERIDEQHIAELIDNYLQLTPEDLHLHPDVGISAEFNEKQLDRALENIKSIFGYQNLDIQNLDTPQRVSFYIDDSQEVNITYRPYTLQNTTTQRPVFSPMVSMSSEVEDEQGNKTDLTYMVKLNNTGFPKGVSASTIELQPNTHKYTTVNSPGELQYLGDVLAVLGQNAANGLLTTDTHTDLHSDMGEHLAQEAQRLLLPRVTMPKGVDLKAFVKSIRDQ